MKLPRYKSRYPYFQFPLLEVDGEKVQLFCRAADLDSEDWQRVRDYAKAKKQQRSLLANANR